MSYITFDFKCRECDIIDSRFVKREEMDSQDCECGSCLPMTRLPAGTRTTFRYADSKLKD